MITITKQNPLGETKVQYTGEVIKHSPDGVVVQAYWTHATKDLGYTRFEAGDCFTEYYYSNRWYNIFDIVGKDGTRKGWYCNVAEPAVIFEELIEQVDLLLDVWVGPRGEVLLLDEDEFAAATMLSEVQRKGAQEGLQELLEMIGVRQGPFMHLPMKREIEGL